MCTDIYNFFKRITDNKDALVRVIAGSLQPQISHKVTDSAQAAALTTRPALPQDLLHRAFTITRPLQVLGIERTNLSVWLEEVNIKSQKIQIFV